MNTPDEVLATPELSRGFTPPSYSPVTRFFAHLFSYIFHPLFIPLYVTWFLMFIQPAYFSGFSAFGKNRLLFLVVLNAIGFPAITILLLKALGFISSVFLH